jgi:hypothetical protein
MQYAIRNQMNKRFALPLLVLAAMIFTVGAQTFTLKITAVNGTIHKKPDKTAYSAGDTIDITGQPDIGYYFTGWTGDVPGSGLMNRVIINSNLNITANFSIWKPPIGIPQPEFGIYEKHTMYSDKTFDFGSGPQPYKDAGNGPYTHYVDSTHANATDTANPFGTAGKPRKSFPSTITAGSVVEVHGRP